jgi:hypothetical protein
MADIIDVAIDSAAAAERKLEEDSDAVEAPVLQLITLAGKLLNSSGYVWFGVTLGVLYSLSNINAVDENATQLVVIARVCFALVFFLLSLPLFSLRRVSAAEAGLLVQLGVGSVKVSARSAKRLKRWHAGVIGIFFTPLSPFLNALLFYIIPMGIMGKPYEDVPMFNLEPGETSLTAFQRAEAWVQGLWNIFVVPWSVYIWYLALKEASVLVSDEVTELRKKIYSTPVTSAEWDSDIVPAAMSLIQRTLPALSRGFGDGLLAIGVGCWASSLGNFANFLDSEANGLDDSGFYFSGVIAMACLPLVIASDVAGASSDCDAIFTTLNEKRQSSMLDAETDMKLQIMERVLRQENKGSGIGFVVGHKVVDRRTLGTILVGMSGVLGTIVPVILALQPNARHVGELPCSLSPTQVSVIQGVLSESSNNTCNFNQTLNEVLAM